MWGLPGGSQEIERLGRHLKSQDQAETGTGQGSEPPYQASLTSSTSILCSLSLQSWGLGRGLRSSHRRKTRRRKKRRRAVDMIAEPGGQEGCRPDGRGDPRPPASGPTFNLEPRRSVAGTGTAATAESRLRLSCVFRRPAPPTKLPVPARNRKQEEGLEIKGGEGRIRWLWQRKEGQVGGGVAQGWSWGGWEASLDLRDKFRQTFIKGLQQSDDTRELTCDVIKTRERKWRRAMECQYGWSFRNQRQKTKAWISSCQAKYIWPRSLFCQRPADGRGSIGLSFVMKLTMQFLLS